MKLLRPSSFKDSIEDIDLVELSKKGKKNLLIDLEGTIVPKETWEISPEKLGWINKAKELGFGICIISNTIFMKRSEDISRKLGAPIIIAALKPLTISFKRALKILNGRRSDSVVIGDQLFMDILGGNLSGIETIYVKHITPERHPLRKFMRWIEQRVCKS